MRHDGFYFQCFPQPPSLLEFDFINILLNNTLIEEADPMFQVHCGMLCLHDFFPTKLHIRRCCFFQILSHIPQNNSDMFFTWLFHVQNLTLQKQAAKFSVKLASISLSLSLLTWGWSTKRRGHKFHFTSFDDCLSCMKRGAFFSAAGFGSW